MLKHLAIRRRPHWSAYRVRVVATSAVGMAPKEKRSGQPRSAHYSSHIKVCTAVLLLPEVLHMLLAAGLAPTLHLLPHTVITSGTCFDLWQVLNVDNATASPSVLLFFDKERFLFNAGEGIQRHFIEHKQRLKRVRRAKCAWRHQQHH